MRLTTQSSNQLQTVFGGGYVLEQHGDEMYRYFPRSEDRECVFDFDAMMKVLRAALSLR
jgi:hypothetical protein